MSEEISPELAAARAVVGGDAACSGIGAPDAQAVLQRFFDLETQSKQIEVELKTMRPAVIDLLKKTTPRQVTGGFIQLDWRAGATEYAPELFDLLDMADIKKTATFSVSAIKRAGLMDEAAPFATTKPAVAVLRCVQQVAGPSVTMGGEEEMA